MKYILALATVGLLLSGCQPAVITSAKWDTVAAQGIKTRCARVDLRSQAAMDEVMSKYDGWNLVYISEYTTSNKVGTDAAVCFQRGS